MFLGGRHIRVVQSCQTVNEALFYLQKTIDANWSKSALDDALRANPRSSRRGKLLTSLVRDGVITVEEAAKRAGLSVAEFQELTVS
jgi:hypothetical protein